ncbi:hypothetical protein BKI51_23210 [Alphaproteobacteria bacterium AO1-B]|nr:hypothetical protein BKI51_23210 [Alphaproteobacteria bacterium AO1-B]
MAKLATKKGCLTSLKVLVVLGLIGWGLLSWFAPTAHVRYRLDVTLEVDGEPVTGSVVQELTVNHGLFRGLSGKLITRTVRGQALALDLPGRGTLFVTMALYCPGKTEWGQCKYGYAYLVDEACAIKKQQPNFAVFVRRFKRLDGSCPITEDQLPVMVRFEDPLRSETAQQVLPQDLGKAFGSDVRFASAGLTFTDIPLSTGIDNHLPWLSDNTSRHLGEFTHEMPQPFYRNLTHGAFKRIWK